MSVSNEPRSRILNLLLDQQDKKMTSTPTMTTTKLCNNNDQEFESTSRVDAAGSSATLTPKAGIQTLVFFDLEASGLKSSTTKSRITELSLIAVSVAQLVSCRGKKKLTSIMIKIATSFIYNYQR